MRRLRPGRYWVTNQEILGDAPKSFIRVWEQGYSMSEPGAWPAYIAKVGHKWYPAESVTEQLMTRIGNCLNMQMADSRLMCTGNQLRFCSRYFLSKGDVLVHGAQIVDSYLRHDGFVEEVRKEQLEQKMLTFETVCLAVNAQFPQAAEKILIQFVRMLGFDALVGNKDRHMWNWGVIGHVTGLQPPRFSPIYDTARGLFWNTSEVGLTSFDRPERLAKYVEASAPLIGCDGKEEVNHFDLVRIMARCKPEYGAALRALGCSVSFKKVAEVIDTDFRHLLSSARRTLIKRCLRLRLDRFEEVLV